MISRLACWGVGASGLYRFRISHHHHRLLKYRKKEIDPPLSLQILFQLNSRVLRPTNLLTPKVPFHLLKEKPTPPSISPSKQISPPPPLNMSLPPLPLKILPLYHPTDIHSIQPRNLQRQLLRQLSLFLGPALPHHPSHMPISLPSTSRTNHC